MSVYSVELGYMGTGKKSIVIWTRVHHMHCKPSLYYEHIYSSNIINIQLIGYEHSIYEHLVKRLS